MDIVFGSLHVEAVISKLSTEQSCRRMFLHVDPIRFVCPHRPSDKINDAPSVALSSHCQRCRIQLEQFVFSPSVKLICPAILLLAVAARAVDAAVHDEASCFDILANQAIGFNMTLNAHSLATEL